MAEIAAPRLALASLAVLVHLAVATPIRAAEEYAVGDSVVVADTEGSGLRLRSGPGMSHKVVTVLAEGSAAKVIGGPVVDGDDDWYQLSSGSSTNGWGLARYLKASTSASAEPPTVAALGLGSTGPISTRHTPDGRRTFVAKTTAYADGVGGVPLNPKTATGTRTRWGVVAVDPKVIPLGSTMKIDGYDDTLFTAEDIGGGVKGNGVDIWLPDPEDAKRYGIQFRLVTIITEGKPR